MTVASGRPDPHHLLDGIPTRNAAVRTEQRGDTLVLFVPLQPRWWTGLARWALPLGHERGFALDRLGAEVWDACDGGHTLEQVIEAFAVRHRIRFHEARAAVLQFLRMLVARNLVAIVVSPEAAVVSSCASSATAEERAS